MGRDERKAAELNEIGWWSGWGNVRWLDAHCYILESEDFDEPFFNRAGFLSCDASAARLRKVEAAFLPIGRDSQVMLFESCKKTESFLKERGYTAVDRMAVMRMRKPTILVNESVRVREAGPGDISHWCDAYLLSFYGNLVLKPRVIRLARRISRADSVTLLIAELGGKVAGVTALFRTPHLLGLYCLGTRPEFRGRGVAHSLLGRAQTIAESEGRILVLQSLLSEGAESFYYKAGFERLYVKEILRKPADAARRNTEESGGGSFGASVKRDAGIGPHLFTGVFQGFEKVPAIISIFGKRTREVLSELQVEVVDEKGYMHINAAKGSVVVSASYLRGGDEKYLYLDVIHELVHVRQHMEGKELWDRHYKYVDRPTELEAYSLATAEARRIGFTDEQLIDYLKVEWVSGEDFARFLVALDVGNGERGRASRSSEAL